MNATNIQPYSRAVVKLLKGIVEKDDVVWNDVLDYQSEILDYISVMGLELIVKKDEGFAFVKQLKLDDDKTLNMTSRRLYGFEVSVILIVLRQILEDFDSIVSFGFLVEAKHAEGEKRYKIHRIIKEKVTLDDLLEFKNKLNDYDAADEYL